MSYINPLHKKRLIIIPCVRNAFAKISTHETPGAVSLMLEGAEVEGVYQINEIGTENEVDIHHFSFLFHANGDPWQEANAYLHRLLSERTQLNRRTDDIRRIASKLLDYLLFCESNGQSWLDFSGVRPSLRPTYRYFYYLINSGNRSNAVINQYTSVVYRFYKYVAECWVELDINRVDTVKQARLVIQSAKGTRLIDVEKRSQTRRVSNNSAVPIGFVREDGEELRPLSNIELEAFLGAIRDESKWSATERLILLTSLMTGARKQTVLTMQLRHLNNFKDERLSPEGTYKIHAGPGTGMDTKNNKSQVIYFPKQLAEDLLMLANSSLMQRRRAKLCAHLEKNFPRLVINEENMYLFLSDQGNCYYMAKSDPRYFLVKSPPSGQVTETIKRKLLNQIPGSFPKDFSYHWLRATYAYQLYQRLRMAVEKGLIQPGEDIDFIQRRMHHESRITTENYLKLFRMTHEKIIAQEIWESDLFGGGYNALKVSAEDA
ncbi:site-specific integrase [Pseudomonas sp. SIMBA_041]|uniref:site-specific integrase n=1 Tax=Pseudomonas sp. SIMBA_041 TaxID=3085782 RepID=UPI00397D44F4